MVGNEAAQLYREARAKWEDGVPLEAEQLYLAAIEADPEFALPHYDLGVMTERSDPQTAVDHYLAVVDHGAGDQALAELVVKSARRVSELQSQSTGQPLLEAPEPAAPVSASEERTAPSASRILAFGGPAILGLSALLPWGRPMATGRNDPLDIQIHWLWDEVWRSADYFRLTTIGFIVLLLAVFAWHCVSHRKPGYQTRLAGVVGLAIAMAWLVKTANSVGGSLGDVLTEIVRIGFIAVVLGSVMMLTFGSGTPHKRVREDAPT